MHIENMKSIEETLASKIKAEFDNGIECINTEEMGAAIDMLKDIETALYHATVTHAMEEYGDTDTEQDYARRYYDDYRYSNGRYAQKGHGVRRGYDEPPYYHMTTDDYRTWEQNRDIDRKSGKMYFSEPITADGTRYSPSGEYTESQYETRKRAYTESKELHKANTPEDKQAKMKDLEDYMRTIADDISEMLNTATAEEKNLVRSKVQTIAQKLA